jgi:hypothetical protein
MSSKIRNKIRMTVKLRCLIILFAAVPELSGQDWARPAIRDLHRVDLRDLGYPDVNEIPANSSAITSLLTATSGKIYGGTSGEEAYLFMYDPVINKVRHLGKIPGQESIHHAIAEGRDGSLYIGTGKDMFREINLSPGGNDEKEPIDKTLWQDILKHYENYEGGHLYRYVPQLSDQKVKLPDMKCDLEDLGIPLSGNSVYALTSNNDEDEIYGITYPDGHFFIYSTGLKKFTDLGPIDSKIIFHGPERYWRSLSRALICDGSGKVFMSGTDGKIRYYDPAVKKIISTGLKVPSDNYYIQFYEDYAVTEYFAISNSGVIYGGTSDGYLFSLDPVDLKLINHGKVRASRRLRALTIGNDGKVYLVAGERSASKPCQFYCYDPATAGFSDLGLLIADRSPYYYWRGQQFDALTTGKDGTIYLGESERRSHLFIYIPE